MPNIGTGFLSGIGSALSNIASTVGSAISGLAPIVANAAAPALAQAVAARIAPRQQVIYQAPPADVFSGGGGAGYTAAVMPGGAIVPNVPTTGGGMMTVANLAGVGGGIDWTAVARGAGQALQQFGGGGVGLGLGPGELGGAPMLGGPRLARQVNVTDARGRIRTYVLAPMVRYRVSISRARRRLGGR